MRFDHSFLVLGAGVIVGLRTSASLVLGGVLLVALDVLVEFGAFALLRYRTFTTAIYGAFRAGFSGAEPALLSMILLLLCIACLTAEFFVRGGARYGRLARGARRGAVRARAPPTLIRRTPSPAPSR